MKKILLIALLFSSFQLFAQHAHHQCGTHVTEAQKEYVRDHVLTVPTPKNGGFTCIPIKPHIVRQTNGSGGATIAEVVRAISYLNEYYAPMQLEFFICGSGPNFLNNTTYYDFNPSQEAAMVAAFGTEANNTINMFFVNSIGGGNIGGYAYLPNALVNSNRIVIDRNFMTSDNGQVIVHEVGHWLSLNHTFEGTEQGPTNPNAERVTRGAGANCTTNGDELCDTEADPGFNGSNVSVANCTYTGTATDNLGALYTPDITNVMSYFPSQCMNPFTLTPGQYGRANSGLTYRQAPQFGQYNMNCPPQNLPAPTNFVATLNGASVTVTWTGNATQVGYFIERSSTSATAGFVCYGGMGVGPGVTTYIDNGPLASNTTYYYRVKTANGGCNTYSNVDSVTTDIIICQPQVSAAPNNCNLPQIGGSAHINRFRLNQGATSLIDNASNCSPNGYQDFTTTTANVDAGSTYGVIINITSPIFFTQNASLWIDFNEDGVFDVSERLYMSTTSSATHNFNITIPAGTTQGFKVLRIRSRPQPDGNGLAEDPCATYQAGETEDYVVFVNNAASACSITNLAAPVMNQGACDPNTNTFTQQVVVTYSNAPATGQLDVNGQLFPITSSPQTVTLTNLPANGNFVNVTASFTADGACNTTLNDAFLAPVSCSSCQITNMNPGIQGPCVTFNNSYTQQITVIYSGAPTTGQLNINGQLFNITGSPQTVTLINLPADSSNVNVTAFFTDNTSCTRTINNLFTAPASCVPCQFTGGSIGTQSACNPATDNYSQTITFEYQGAPTTGQVSVNGQLFPITGSPQTVTLTNLPANGNPVDLDIFFTANTTCLVSQSGAFTAPASCLGTLVCSAGDVASNLDGTTVDYCPGTNLTLNTDGSEVILAGEDYLWVFLNATDTFFIEAGTNYTGDLNADIVGGGGQPIPFGTYLVFGLVTENGGLDICDVTDGDFTVNVLPSTSPVCSGATVCSAGDVATNLNGTTINYCAGNDLTVNTNGTQVVLPGEFYVWVFLNATDTFFLNIGTSYTGDLNADLIAGGGTGIPFGTYLVFGLVTENGGLDICDITQGDFFVNVLPAGDPACTAPACTISNVTAGTQTSCVAATNTYTQQVTITYSNAPTTGQLFVNGQQFPITGSPQTVTLTNLNADGAAVNVTVGFTSLPTCNNQFNAVFFAPASCGASTVCTISNVTAGTQTSCVAATNTYTQQVTITYSNAPTTGQLFVNGQQFPITASPQTVTLTNLDADGAAVNVTVGFTSLPTCNNQFNAVFTAPASCGASTVCTISNVTAGTQTACVAATNTYTQEVTITYANAPTTGQLVVNGQFFAITGSPQTVTLTGLDADGAPVNVIAGFSSLPACNSIANALFTAPASCGVSTVCAINGVVAGTQSACNTIDDTYSQDLIITYTNAPTSGQLVVNGEFFPITGSPQTVTLEDLDADGNIVDVVVTFTNATTCFNLFNAVFTAPAPCFTPGATKPLVVIMYPEGAGTLYVGNDVITATPFTGNYPLNQLLNVEADAIGTNVFTRWKNNASPLFDYDASSAFVFNVQDTLFAYFNGSVSINDVESIFENLMIYPTVTNSLLTIEFTLSQNANLSIDLFSIDGKMIKNFVSPTDTQFANVAFKETFEVGDVAKGLYFVRILSDKAVSTHKIIVAE